jgi:DNA-directed RNA polymerase specialized sigma24 family protein
VKVKITYNGQIIWVDKRIKECLEHLKREEQSRNRKIRRRESIWLSISIDIFIYNNKSILTILVEDYIIHKLDIQALLLTLNDLSEYERELVTDRYFRSKTYKEIALKNNIAISTAEYRIKIILKKMKKNFDKVLRDL